MWSVCVCISIFFCLLFVNVLRLSACLYENLKKIFNVYIFNDVDEYRCCYGTV
jgi:hypothetical protein